MAARMVALTVEKLAAKLVALMETKMAAKSGQAMVGRKAGMLEN